MPEPMMQSAKAKMLSPGEGETLSVVGDRIRVLADGAASGGRCFIFEETAPPGSGPPVHRHSVDDEYFYVLEGRVRFVVDGKEFIAEKGAFLCAPRGSTHAFSNIGDAPSRMLVVYTPPGLEGPFREAHEAGASATPDQLAGMFAKFGVLFTGPPLGRG